MKQQRPFRDKKTLDSLKTLRKKGYTYPSLAFIFNVDFSTVYHHVKGLMPRQHVVFNVGEILGSTSVNVGDLIAILHLEVKHPKNYAEYLKRNEYPIITRALSNIS
jgi:hypothetical protein